MDEARTANRRVWDAWTPVHVASRFYDVESFRNGQRPIRVADYEREELGDVTGKTLLHLQCHFGLDTLSWARLGARVTGADFSGEAVRAARQLAAEVGLAATFVESDLYALPDVLNGTFDIVYTSCGVLGWLPDIVGWAGVVAHFLAPGGTFYITEKHPIADVFDDEAATVGPGVLRPRYPYWTNPDPLHFVTKGSYADPTADTSGLDEYAWDHSLGEIMTALARAGLHLEFLHEFDFCRWQLPFLVLSRDGRWRLPAGSGELPLFFSLLATKPA